MCFEQIYQCKWQRKQGLVAADILEVREKLEEAQEDTTLKSRSLPKNKGNCNSDRMIELTEQIKLFLCVLFKPSFL